jgi:hypothetical protein
MMPNYQELIEESIEEPQITNEFVKLAEEDLAFRQALYAYFVNNANRKYALKLLDSFCNIRRKDANGISAELIMMACYFVGMHHQIEDCLTIWEAKHTDFDTYCMVDIQLVAFNGVAPALDYFQNHGSTMAQKAYQYTLMCYNGGDFEAIEAYFSKELLPWYIARA